MTSDSPLPRARALDISCYAGSLEDAADAVIDRAASGLGGYGVLCNVHVLMTAESNPAVRAALDDAWMVFPDGAPVAWLLRRSGAPEARRIGGPDLMRTVLDRGRSRDVRHFLFGSTQDVLDNLNAALEESYQGVTIVGSYAPEWGAENDASALRRIADAGADVAWIALGAPKQELWMQQHAPTLGRVLALGVGAAFDFHAGTKPRAPGWMQRAGLEWLHRLGSEPRRLGVRYFTSNSRFAVRAVLDRVRSGRRPS